MSKVPAQTKNLWSSTKATAIRLVPHQDLKKELLKIASNSKAGFIITCVGSLEQVNLRFANQENGTFLKGHFEILSLVGTFADSGAHLHISVADSTGKTWGGHLLDDSLIYTTAEIVIGELNDLQFDRVHDSTYGYKELSIRPQTKKKN
jgi:uncharacterized protein